ncbi:hypothetical protein L1049_003670 [Liquidambar formosana]|uniref:Uncharacterized protein n=1 Tax=Liquidambar formosana TaxID=63359 RepID=A0AAP0WXR1_LIQFO
MYAWEERSQSDGLFLMRILRRRLILKYSCMLKKLKQYYRDTINELAQPSSSLESYQQKRLREASLAVPSRRGRPLL